jgi:hypothetical protein
VRKFSIDSVSVIEEWTTSGETPSASNEVSGGKVTEPARTVNPVKTTGFFGVKKGFRWDAIEGGNLLRLPGKSSVRGSDLLSCESYRIDP